MKMVHLDLNLERAWVNNLGFGDSEREVRDFRIRLFWDLIQWFRIHWMIQTDSIIQSDFESSEIVQDWSHLKWN